MWPRKDKPPLVEIPFLIDALESGSAADSQNEMPFKYSRRLITSAALAGALVLTYGTSEFINGAVNPILIDKLQLQSAEDLQNWQPKGIKYLPPGTEQPIPTLIFRLDHLKAEKLKDKRILRKIVKCAYDHGPCPPPSTYSTEHQHHHSYAQPHRPNQVRHHKRHHQYQRHRQNNVVYFN